MGSFFQDLPGPVRDRRASLPAAGHPESLTGGEAAEDQFYKQPAEDPGDRGLLDGNDPQYGNGDWLDTGANPRAPIGPRWEPVPSMEQQQAEQARQGAAMTYLHGGEAVDSGRAADWVGDRYRQVNADPAAQLPADWAAREHDPSVMLNALEAQEENPDFPATAEDYVQGYEEQFNPYMQNPRQRGRSRGMLDSFDREFAAGESLDDQDITLPGNAPSWAPRRDSNYRSTVIEGRNRLAPIPARPEPPEVRHEWAHRRKVRKAMKYVDDDGQAIKDNDPRVAGLDPSRRGGGAAKGAADKPASAAKPGRSALSRLFNMKSGYANPLAWLYQAGKGIGRGLSSIFGGKR